MTFAGRVVVMNGGRIEQIGRPRAKREPSPNQSVSLMVPRGGLTQANEIIDLRVVGTPRSSHTIIRLFCRRCPTINRPSELYLGAGLSPVSFPKIISARSDDAIRTEWVWQ